MMLRSPGVIAVPAGLQPIHKIVALGDSITNLSTRPHGFITIMRDYLNVLFPQQPIEIVNAGVRSETSGQMLARFDHDVIQAKPDLVLVMAGMNDIGLGVSAADYQKNLRIMQQQAASAHIPVIFISMPITPEAPERYGFARSKEFNAVALRVANDTGAKYVDVSGPLTNLVQQYRNDTGAPDNLVTVDGVHLTAAGQRVVANIILNNLGVTPELRRQVVTTSSGADF
jgi:lysophospholipase L1-like esterase